MHSFERDHVFDFEHEQDRPARPWTSRAARADRDEITAEYDEITAEDAGYKAYPDELTKLL